jgi:hypothetical protein
MRIAPAVLQQRPDVASRFQPEKFPGWENAFTPLLAGKME